MPTLTITDQNFTEIAKSGIVFVDFWAAWCGPCRAFAPVFEAAATRHPDVVFGKVDTEAQPGLASAFQIRSIPTLMVLRDGVLLASQPGSVPGAVLDAMVAEVKGLDMDEVRRSIEAHAAKSAPAPRAGVH